MATRQSNYSTRILTLFLAAMPKNVEKGDVALAEENLPEAMTVKMNAEAAAKQEGVT